MLCTDITRIKQLGLGGGGGVEADGTICRPFVEELNMEISITDYSVVLV